MQNAVTTDELLDQFQIAQMMQSWGNWRDTGDWERLRNCYTPDATMVTTWYDGPATGFLEASIQGRARQPKDRGGMHIIGGTTSHVKGDRAIAETRITLLLRGVVQNKLVDVTVYGRFLDCLLKSGGQWRIQSREPVYDRDFMRTVDPGDSISLDAAELAKYPFGFRHLAYLQSSEGHSITLSIPDQYSDGEKAIYARGKSWLEGASA